FKRLARPRTSPGISLQPPSSSDCGLFNPPVPPCEFEEMAAEPDDCGSSEIRGGGEDQIGNFPGELPLSENPRWISIRTRQLCCGFLIQDADITRLEPALPFNNAELDLTARDHAQVSVGEIVGVNEYVLAAIAGRDETITLDIVETNHFA